MKINDIQADALQILFDKVEAKDVDIMNMKIDDVLRCMVSQEELVKYVDEQDLTTMGKIGFIKGFINKANQVFSIFKKYNNDIPMEYNQACGEINDSLSMPEQIITDCVEWYHKTTSEVGELPFFDWYIMKRKQALNGAVERRYQAIINKKYEQQRANNRH